MLRVARAPPAPEGTGPWHAQPGCSSLIRRRRLPQGGSFPLLRATLWVLCVGAFCGARASGASPHTTELAGAYAHSVTMLSGQYALYWHVQADTLHLAMDVNTTGTWTAVIAAARTPYGPL